MIQKLKDSLRSSDDLLKPVALLIKSSTAPLLPELNNEIEKAGQELAKAGFVVKILEGTDHEKIGAALDSSSPFFGRISLLHYTGHSSKDGIMVGDEEKSALLGYEHLKERLKHHKSLRLLFLNSCQSDGLIKRLDNTLEGTVKVITDSKIPDKQASEITAWFYKHFLEAKSSASESICAANEKHQTRLLGLSDDQGENRGILDEPDSSPEVSNPPPFPWKIASNNDTSLAECHLAVLEDYMKKQRGRDKDSYFPWGPILGYAVVALFCWLSACSAHLWKTSPAFQAAFSYGPSIEQVRTGKFRDVVDAEKAEHFDTVLASSPKFGAIVETVRAGILCIFAIVIGYFLYNPFERPFRLPRPRESRGLFKNLKATYVECPLKFKIVLTGFLIVVIGTIIYHHNAPITLMDENDRWNKELGEATSTIHFKDHQLLWENASASVRDPQWSWTDLRNDEAYSHNQLANHKNFKRLFVKPYWWYFPYSLCMFALVAYPILVATFKGTYKTFRELYVGLKMLEKCLVMSNSTIPDRVTVNILSHANFRSCNEIGKFLVLVILILVVASFEAYFGYYTLAPLAQIFTIFAMILIFSAFGICLLTVRVYSSVYSLGKEAILNNDEELSRLEKRSPWNLITNRTNRYLWIPISSLAGLIYASPNFTL